MLYPNRLLLTCCCLVACPYALGAQDEPAQDGGPVQATHVVTLGDPPARDPLSPDRVEREAVVPRDEDGNPLVGGILGIPATRLEVDPRVLGVAPGDPLPTLRREGEFLRNRMGQLLTSDERGYAVFVLDADEANDERAIAMVVAPNRALESMQLLVKQRGQAIAFSISGQVHTYRGVNYLMITAPPRQQLQRVAPEQDAVQDDAQAAEEPALQEADPLAQTPEQEPADAAPLSPEEELEQLLGQRGGGPIGSERDPGSASGGASGAEPSARLPEVQRGGSATNPTVAGTAPRQAQADLKEEGAFVLQRAGRIVRSGDGAHALFVFDADGGQAPQPPMILQACKLLEEIESTLFANGDHLPFIITGQIQTYRGANYLLPSILRQEFDLGNLE